MRLYTEGDRFWLESTYAEKDVAKLAGFRWDPARRRWYTQEAIKAAKLAAYADAELRNRLVGVIEQQQVQQAANREASRALDAPADLVIPAPEGLAYLAYQRAGIAYAASKPGVLIADDMGLGKTIQAIGVYNTDPSIRSVLVICPASLKLNWLREFRKWSVRPIQGAMAVGTNVPPTDLVVINYDIVLKNAEKLHAREWDLIVVDEAHALKNREAQRTLAILGGTMKAKRGSGQPGRRVKALQARRRIFMTGTPVLNRPSELWTLVKSLDPQGLGADFWTFHKRYCNAHQSGYGWDMTGASNLGELQQRLRERCMIRRTKAEVLTELPPKRRQLVTLAANGAGDAIAEERRMFDRLEDRTARARPAIALAEAAGDEGAYLAAIAELKAAQNVAFTEMSKIRHKTAVAKIPYLIEHLHEAIEASGKVVAFAHHLDVIDALATEFGRAAVVVTGQTSLVDRQAAVDRFQSDPSCTLFIGNILAAGVGLTLTASAHVVFGELDWRPGIVTQAEDRTHRIGQRNAVLVQHVVFDESVDAIMAQRIVDKQAVIDAALDDDDGEDCGAVGDERLDEAIAAAADRQAADAAHAERVDADRRAARDDIAARHADPSMDRRAALDAEAALMTPEQREAVSAGLRFMSGLDTDRAKELNGIGYNKADSYLGAALAAMPSLSPRQAVVARKMLRKYRRQLGDGMLEAMGVVLSEKQKKRA